MGKKIDEFLQVQEKKSEFVCSAIKKIKKLDYEDDFLSVCENVHDIEKIILDLCPANIRAITTQCYALGLYAKFIDDDNAYKLIQNIDRKSLWDKAKPNAAARFISYNSYLDVLHDIGMYEECNALYYQSLFRVIYEGVYNDDMSVIANLRASDIQDDIISLHTDDGYSYKMRLPKDLLEDLKELAESNEWERKNRYGIHTVNTTGKYPDSVFKIQKQKADSKNTYRYGYYNRLRKIAKNYVEYYLSPSQLFVSGIMHRICEELKNNNISVEYAFSDNSKNEKVRKIIEKELSRCEYDIPVNAFREQVISYLDVFL